MSSHHLIIDNCHHLIIDNCHHLIACNLFWKADEIKVHNCEIDKNTASLLVAVDSSLESTPLSHLRFLTKVTLFTWYNWSWPLFSKDTTLSRCDRPISSASVPPDRENDYNLRLSAIHKVLFFSSSEAADILKARRIASSKLFLGHSDLLEIETIFVVCISIVAEVLSISSSLDWSSIYKTSESLIWKSWQIIFVSPYHCHNTSHLNEKNDYVRPKKYWFQEC